MLALKTVLLVLNIKDDSCEGSDEQICETGTKDQGFECHYFIFIKYLGDISPPLIFHHRLKAVHINANHNLRVFTTVGCLYGQ